MKRGSQFLIAVATAAITFATLTFSFGPTHWRHHRYAHGYDQQNCPDQEKDVKTSNNNNQQ